MKKADRPPALPFSLKDGLQELGLPYTQISGIKDGKPYAEFAATLGDLCKAAEHIEKRWQAMEGQP